MHCHSCDYPLWDTSGRICPECGTPFSLHDFRFRPGAVRFCCPHCRQDYYGTSPAGHLEPESFTCIRCARPVSMEQMVVVPVEGVTSPMQDAGFNPWLSEKAGLLTRWWRTVGTGVSRPTHVALGTPVSAPAGAAVVYAMLNVGFIISIAFIPALLLGAIFGGFAIGGGGAAGAGQGAAVLLGVIAMQQVSSLLSVLLFIVLWSAVAHAVLRMSGETRGGFNLTLAAVCYSSGCYIIAIVPCIGAIGAVYWVVVAGIMLAAVQRVSGPRAALATIIALVAPGVACIGIAIGFGGFNAFLTATRGPRITVTPPPRPMDVSSRASRLQDAILAYYTRTGVLPDHPARLLAAGSLFPDDLGADPVTERISGLTLTEFTTAFDSQADRAIRDELNQGRGFIGEVLFAPPADPAAPQPDLTVLPGQMLWLAIVTPDLGRPLMQPIYVVTAWGPLKVQPGQFERLRAEENERRAALGLPPFPDPTTVPRR